MFTGIIQTIGHINACKRRGGDLYLTVAFDQLAGELKTGDSVAVNGCCLTVVGFGENQFSADVSRETLNHTTIGDFSVDTPVNLETAATPATLLGGHMVSGHVDAVTRVISKTSDARSERIDFELPASLARFVAKKGSICIDGVSLTVNTVSQDSFSVNIVPHTQQATVIKHYQTGTRVNLEVDIVARYLARLAEAQAPDMTTTLIENGFIKR